MLKEDYPALLETFQKHVATRGAYPFRAECRYRHKNGTTVHFYCKGRVIEWDESDGSPVRMVGTHTDITELRERQKKTQMELERNLRVEFSELELLNRIGEGSFGYVFKCTYHGMTMAAKCIKSSMIQRNWIKKRRTQLKPLKEVSGDFSLHDGHEMHSLEFDEERKIESPENDAIMDFHREIEILIRLRHPNIVLLLLLAYSVTPKYEVALYELMQCSLEDVLQHHERKRTKLEPEKQIQYAVDLSRGMLYLHTREPIVIHRDLKPSNLLIDHSGVLKVCDFGIAKLLQVEDRSTSAGHVMTGETGTYRFMAPEVFLRKPYDEKVDIYSFALNFYHILNVERPWPSLDGRTAAELAAEGKRPPLDNKWDSCLRRLLNECWQEDASARPSFGTILNVLTTYQEEALEIGIPRIRLTSQTSSSNSCCVIH